MNQHDEAAQDAAPPASAAQPGISAAALGGDERRMHVRAYNHWVSLLGSGDCPPIAGFDPAAVGDFAPNSVLLDFTGGIADPATPYIGSAIREECGLAGDIGSLGEAPRHSLLARLGAYYEQILAERAPVGFEADFVNRRDQTISYRGMLMPFTSGGDTIDFLYGVVNWKTAEERGKGDEPQPGESVAAADMPMWEDGPGAGSEDRSLDEACSALRRAAPIALDALDPDQEFALTVTRRGADGRHEVVALVDDPALLERALRQLG